MFRRIMAIEASAAESLASAMRADGVALTDQVAVSACELARLEGVPQARVIREAIAAYEGRRAADRAFRLEGVAEGVGGSIADIPEQELLAGFGE